MSAFRVLGKKVSDIASRQPNPGINREEQIAEREERIKLREERLKNRPIRSRGGNRPLLSNESETLGSGVV
jgi:hypothetical protein